jgi:hypothetical protein
MRRFPAASRLSLMQTQRARDKDIRAFAVVSACVRVFTTFFDEQVGRAATGCLRATPVVFQNAPLRSCRGVDKRRQQRRVLLR